MDARRIAYDEGIQLLVNAEARRLGVPAPIVQPSFQSRPGLSHDATWSLWSPTLHLHRTYSRHDLEDISENIYPWDHDDDDHGAAMAALAAYDVDMAARLLIYDLLPTLEEQAYLRGDAARLGIDQPIDDLTCVDHLHIDRWVHETLISHGHAPVDIARRIVKAMDKEERTIILQMSVTATGTEMKALVNARMHHAADDTPLPMVEIMLPVEGRATSDGRRFMIPDIELPETVIDTIVGKPLGSIVETKSPLAARAIIGSEPWITLPGSNPALCLLMEPDPVAV